MSAKPVLYIRMSIMTMSCCFCRSGLRGRLWTNIESTTYRLLVEALELALERPVVEFHQVSSSEGIEHIEEIRRLTGA